MVDAVSLASVLQELMNAALDLFGPEGRLEDFLQRLTLRLGCLAALWVEVSSEGQVQLLGSAGLSRASRELPLSAQVQAGDGAQAADVSWGALSFPYPELAGPPLSMWQFPVARAPEEDAPLAALLLFFDPSQRLSQQYFGLVERLTRVVRRALQHRSLDARVHESEQRLMEQKMLLESENEATLDGILVVSATGRIISYNRRLLEMWGITREMVDSAGLAQALLPLAVHQIRDSARFLEFVRRVMQTPEEEGSEELALVDGRSLELFTAPLRNVEGGVAGRGWYLRDITPRRRAEAERARLLEREQAARQAAEQARHRADFLAEASRRLAGHLEPENVLTQATRVAVPGLGDWCAALVLEGDALRICAVAHREPSREVRLGALLQQRLPLELSEGAPQVGRTGQTVQAARDAGLPLAPFGLQSSEHLAMVQEAGAAAYLAVPLLARGMTLGVLMLISSRAEHSYSQEERVLAEDLAARVALALDNARLYEEAQRAIRIREEFLSVAAHELFTPLTSLRLTAQNLLRTLDGQGRPSSSMLRIIDAQTRKLMRLVSELLDVSRIQSGVLSFQIEEIDLGQVTREVLEQFGPELERSGSSLKLDVEPHVTGRWDRLRLEQVLQNLLSNAVKYGQGKPIEVKVREEGGMARLVVRDEGMGIPPEDQARIFGPFERAISSRHFGGLGLGLYIAQRIVWQLGGSIRLHSEPGRGTTFIVELPRASLGAHSAPSAELQSLH